MKKNLIRLGMIATIAGLILVFWAYDLGEYLSFASLKANQALLQENYMENKGVFIALYMLIYIISTAISLPGATILTLAGGAIFGLTLGTILISFASTIGATGAFLVSRFLLKEAFEKKFRDRLATINKGIEKDGAFYLFTLRLVPLLPFFAVNILMGLTKIRVFTYFFTSQVGMLLGTIVYVNAGTQLAQLESLGGILSLPLILSFCLLGIFPWVAKFIVGIVKSRKIYAKFSGKKPRKFQYNMIVIGAGSAGLVSAYIAAAVKAKVLLVERHKMGGDCLNTGCVPSKALIRSAKMLSYAKRAKEFGFRSTTVDFSFSDVMERVQSVIKKVEPHDSMERYRSLGVECTQGEATIKDPWHVEVDGKVYSTKNIVVATGARPLVPDFPGLKNIDYLHTDNVWELRELPKRFLVLGGGPIGSELAQCFQRLGSQVTIVEGHNTVLNREDTEVSTLITEKFRKEGINVLSGHMAKSFSVDNGEKSLLCATKDGKETRVVFDKVLIALGRRANVTSVGLENLGVEITPRGTIEADSFLRTNFPNIYVCGDVTGPYQFTHTAAHQAWFVAVNALFSPLKKFPVDYRVIPWCTYTDPEVARVGLSEREAGEKGVEYEVTQYGIDDLDRAIADSEDHGFIKVLTVPGKDKILGVTIVGSHAGDLIVEFVAAMKHGFGLNKILGTIHIYPTLGESNKYVAGNWKKAHSPKKVLEFLGKFHAWRRG